MLKFFQKLPLRRRYTAPSQNSGDNPPLSSHPGPPAGGSGSLKNDMNYSEFQIGEKIALVLDGTLQELEIINVRAKKIIQTTAGASNYKNPGRRKY